MIGLILPCDDAFGIPMKFEDYEKSERFRYERLARAVEKILKHWLQSTGAMVAPPQLQSRAKDVGSLRRKLESRGLLGADGIEAEIKDLAGCRIIFYTATDLERFRQSEALRSQFDVDWSLSKIHFPGKEASDDELYQGIHYIVSLKAARTGLVEYRDFSDLRCEIQLQTILNHAWSEMSHEALYKARDVPGFGSAQRARIRKRFTRVMREHLMEAGYDMQRIQEDVERLKAGLAVFDGVPLERLKTATDNNVRVDVLDDIRSHLLPGLDDVSRHLHDIRSGIIAAIEASRVVPVVARTGLFGGLRGATCLDVTKRGLEILETIRDAHPDEVFAALLQLWEGAGQPDERSAIEGAVSRLAMFSFPVWERYGASVQLLLTRELIGFAPERLARLRDVVLLVCRGVFGTEIDSVEATSFDTVTFRKVGVQAHDALTEARANAVVLGLAALQASATSDAWRNSWSALWTGARSAGRKDLDASLASDQMKLIVDLCTVVKGSAGRIPFDVRQQIEEDLYWGYRHLGGRAGGQPVDAGVTDKAAALEALVACRDVLNADIGFVTYKTLVGFRTVFVAEWNQTIDVRDKEKLRTEEIGKLAAAVTAETLPEWVRIAVTCAETQSNDMATFPPLIQFFKAVCGRAPELGLRMLLDGGKALEGFAPAFFPELLQSKAREAALASMASWVGEGRSLRALGRALLLAGEPLPDLISGAATRAVAAADMAACCEVSLAALRYGTAENGLFERALAPSVAVLNGGEIDGLASSYLLDAADVRKLAALPEAVARVVVENFTVSDTLDDIEQTRLAALYERFPELVWDMLQARLVRGHDGDLADVYEPVPQYWNGFETALGQDVVAVYDRVAGWGDGEDAVRRWHKAELLAGIYHACDDAFLAGLQRIIERDGESALPFTCEVLRHFEGAERLDGVCQVMVMAVGADAAELGDVRSVIEASGVLHGEFGRAEMLEGKANRLRSWLTHEDAQVLSFARAFIADLERWALDERRRATEAHERRKRDFDRGEE